MSRKIGFWVEQTFVTSTPSVGESVLVNDLALHTTDGHYGTFHPFHVLGHRYKSENMRTRRVDRKGLPIGLAEDSYLD